VVDWLLVGRVTPDIKVFCLATANHFAAKTSHAITLFFKPPTTLSVSLTTHSITPHDTTLAIMFRATVRSANTVAKRNFSTTKVRSVHYPEGPYHNLPFKVHNRKIPYAFLHFGFFREYYIQPAPQVSEMRETAT
jgi:cytochrome c oxidase subunit 7c